MLEEVVMAKSTISPPERYLCGKIKQQHAQAVSPALLQRIRTDGLRLGADPRLATELGRLWLNGDLSTAQAAAGFRMAEIWGRNDRRLGKIRSVRSPSYMTGFSGDPDVADERLDDDEKAAKAKREDDVKDAYEGVFKLLQFSPWYDILERLVVDNEMVNPAYVADIAMVLDRLAAHFRGKGERTTGKQAAQAAKARIRRREPPSSTATAATPAAIAPARTDWQREFIRALRPDLDADGVRQVVETMQALRERDRFRADKGGKR